MADRMADAALVKELDRWLAKARAGWNTRAPIDADLVERAAFAIQRLAALPAPPPDTGSAQIPSHETGGGKR